MRVPRSHLVRARAQARTVRGLVAVQVRELIRRSENAARVDVGAGTYVLGGPRVVAYRGDEGRVHIGRYSSIADGVQFLVGGGHRTDWVTTFPLRIALGLPGAYEDGHPHNRGDIHVGSDVWIGKDATIMSGVRIGDGAIVATAAVVTRDVGPYEIVGGNPARLIRERVTAAQRDALLELCWWDWPEEDVRTLTPLLCSDRIDEFISAARAHLAR